MDRDPQTDTRDPARWQCAPADLLTAVETDPAIAAALAEWWDGRKRPPERPRRHDARTLTGAGNEAEIVLDGTRYVLRITRQRKLILTK
jgi:hemin uptake protein HemP